jgi:sugar/nucleoside kinase (ribokinase family)
MSIVYGMGNPLMDIILSGCFEKLEELEVRPGTMNLIETEFSAKVRMGCKVLTRLPGGSCSNTLRAIAWLSEGQNAISPVFTGAVGKDSEGDLFGEILRAQHVEARLVRKDSATGASTIIVTPDHERTMFTCLGACRKFEEADLDFSLLEKADLFHTTGYMWDTPNQENAVKKAITAARDNGTKVSFDIADPFVAVRYRDALSEWLPGRIDILFANKDELKELTRCEGSDEEIIRCALDFSPLVVMKVGARGCYVGTADALFQSGGNTVTPVDTTGAGDTFAGGFLYGYLKNCDLAGCAAVANSIAAEMVTIEGCNFNLLDRERILVEGG